MAWTQVYGTFFVVTDGVTIPTVTVTTVEPHGAVTRVYRTNSPDAVADRLRKRGYVQTSGK